LIGVSLTTLFLFLNVYYAPSFSQRIPKVETIQNAINEKDNKNNVVTTSSDGSGRRIFVWKASMDLIKQNFWLGVGTGDSKDQLLETYKSNGMITEYKFQLNAHNQYLNTMVSLGVFGLLILLLCFLIPLYYAVKNKLIMLLGFTLIVSFNFLFESMLEAQAGVIFYVFFNTILCLSFMSQSEWKKEEASI
jgi:O-antigen ligase